MCSHVVAGSTAVDETQSKKYETYLKTRPASMEMEAIELVTKMAVKYEYVSKCFKMFQNVLKLFVHIGA